MGKIMRKGVDYTGGGATPPAPQQIKPVSQAVYDALTDKSGFYLIEDKTNPDLMYNDKQVAGGGGTGGGTAETTTFDGSTSSLSATNVQDAIDEVMTKKANSTHSHSNATTSSSGFMSSTDKTKLDNIDLSKYVISEDGIEYEDPEQTTVDVANTANNALKLNGKSLTEVMDYSGLSNKPMVDGQVVAYPASKTNFVRNIFVSTADPSASDGVDGDVWLKVGE